MPTKTKLTPIERLMLAKGLARQKVETATISVFDCALCGKSILLGDSYFNGGYGRRAHFNCVENES